MVSCALDRDFSEEFIPESFGCVMLPLPNSPNGWRTIFPHFSASGFTFNPRNDYQLIYSQFDHRDENDSVFLYDLYNQKRSFLFEGKTFFPNWGAQNWILDGRGSIYRYKLNESGFSRIPFPGICSRPVWAPDGKTFTFRSLGNGTDFNFIAMWKA